MIKKTSCLTAQRAAGTYPPNCFDPREERCWLVRYTPMPKRTVKTNDDGTK